MILRNKMILDPFVRLIRVQLMKVAAKIVNAAIDEFEKFSPMLNLPLLSWHKIHIE